MSEGALLLQVIDLCQQYARQNKMKVSAVLRRIGRELVATADGVEVEA